MNHEENIIHVSLIGIERTKEIISHACVDGMISLVVELLSENRELCTQNMRWVDRENDEILTPPIFIGIDYGNAELVTRLLPLHDDDILNTMRAGCGDHTAVEWACWVVSSPVTLSILRFLMTSFHFSRGNSSLNVSHLLFNYEKGSLDIVKILVEDGGAKVTEDAIVLARDEGHNSVAEYLKKHVDWYTVLEGDADAMMEKACREGDLGKVKHLVDVENYNIEKWKDESGTCIALAPMYSAVRNGHVEIIQYFAEQEMQL